MSDLTNQEAAILIDVLNGDANLMDAQQKSVYVSARVKLRNISDGETSKFEHGWQQTNSEIQHQNHCRAGADPTQKCGCGALAHAQGLCAYCADSGDERLMKNPATRFFNGGKLGLCEGDAEMMLQDDAVEPELKIEYKGKA